MGVTLPFVKEGKLVALAVTSPQRASVLPDVPSLGELMAEFKRPETSHAILAPAGTPRPILNQVSKEIARILALPDVKERLQNISYITAPTTPEEYTKILRGQIDGLTTLVQAAGLKPK
jgi:tripartite-type tricarboxylate transporter receptor subunit TctC